MTPDQMSNMNMWVAIIAIASVIQVAALFTVALVGYRLYARARVALDDVQRQIEPVSKRVSEVLDSVNHEVARLRRAGDRVEDSMAAVHSGVSTATSMVKGAVMPGWAVTRGILAAVSAFTKRDHQNARLGQRPARQEFQVNRFVNEGGNDARDEELRF